MGRLVDQETIDDKVYKLYDIEEKGNDFTNEITFPWSMYFDQSLITENDKPKYLVGLYQDGEIWSENECWGTKIVDLETIKIDNQFSYIGNGVDLCYYITNNIIFETLHVMKTEDLDEIYI